jgi:hypothetical protein
MDDKEQMLQSGFCKECLAGSTSDSPGGISSINGIGRKFYGDAEKCPTCGSAVRVLWFVFCMIPIIPLGSYRFQETESGVVRSRFLARKTHTRWPQVFTHWAVGLVLGVVAFALIAAYADSKKH